MILSPCSRGQAGQDHAAAVAGEARSVAAVLEPPEGQSLEVFSQVEPDRRAAGGSGHVDEWEQVAVALAAERKTMVEERTIPREQMGASY